MNQHRNYPHKELNKSDKTSTLNQYQVQYVANKLYAHMKGSPYVSHSTPRLIRFAKKQKEKVENSTTFPIFNQQFSAMVTILESVSMDTED